MPSEVFSPAERERLERFPRSIDPEDVNRYFRLTDTDLAFLRARSSLGAWLAGGVQMGALRMLGFVPSDLRGTPKGVVSFVASQLGVPSTALAHYTRRPETRRQHLLDIEAHLGWRRHNRGDLKALADWLLERALEHDQPRALFELACERLRSERVVRPGVTVLERRVSSARERAVAETWLRLAPQLTTARRAQLDALLEVDNALHMSRLAWLRTEAPTARPAAIKEQLAKLGFLRAVGAQAFDVGMISPNRRSLLARTGRRSTAQALGRMGPERRYQILVATLAEALIDVTDETVDLFDLALASTDHNARAALAELRERTAQATNEKVRLLVDIGRAVLDPAVDDSSLRARIYQVIDAEHLASALDEAERLARPADGNYLDLLEARYSVLRQFTPAVISALEFRSARRDDQLLAAVGLLRELNAQGRRAVPPDAPTGFAPARWRPYLYRSDGRVDRHYWELCVLSELRGALRAGNIWLERSRRYADPTSYLIPPQQWERLRDDFVQLTGIPPQWAGPSRPARGGT